MSEPLLTVEGVDASYGPVQILFGLDVEIERGEIVALLGTNGAGKSTLFRCITGLLPPTRGRITFDGHDLVGRTADEIAELGVVMMPGGRSVFPTLTVRENLRLASWLQRKDPAAVAAAEERVLHLFPRLEERIDQMAGNLSGGEQQMLAVSQALIPDPRLLLIDELSLGLAPTIVGQLVDVVRQVHAEGLTVVVVEQSVNVALELAERAVFMEKGEFRFTGSTRELLERPDILRSVFISGTDAGAAPSTPGTRGEPAPDAPVVLECRGVTKRFGGIVAVDGVDLELREGQILGLIGQNGAGKTTLFDCVSGFLPVDDGRIVLGGHDLTALPPHRRAEHGLGLGETRGRLVEQEHHRLQRDDAGDVHGSPGPGGELRQRRIAVGLEAHEVDQALDLPEDPSLRGAHARRPDRGQQRVPDRFLLQGGRDGLPDREGREQAGALEGAAHAAAGPLVGPEAAHVRAGQQHAASVCGCEARHDVEQGRLAGAVGADDADHLPRCGHQVHSAQGLDAAEADREVTHLEGGRACRVRVGSP